MSSCNSNTIRKTFIIEPLDAGAPITSACTAVYTNLLQSCSGDTSIELSTGDIIFNGVGKFDNISATTIEAITYLSGGTNILDIVNASDTFVTGGTFNNFTDSIQLTRNDGANVIITGLTDFYTTGATLINDTVYFDRTDTLSAFTLDLSNIDINDTFVTGFTYDDSNNLTVTRNDGTSITTTISTMSGLTINGILNVTGDTNLEFISGSSISINGGEVMTRIPSSIDFQLFGNQSATGLIEYGGLSGNTFDNSKFDIGPLKGWIIDNTTNPEAPSVSYIDYSGSTGSNPSGITLTYLSGSPVSYIGISGTTIADIIQQTTPFTPDQHRDVLELGVIVHSDNTIVNVTNDLPLMAIDPISQFYDLVFGIGYFNLNLDGQQGNVYYGDGANLNINKTVGDIFAHGSNYTNDPKNPHVKNISSATTITFRYRLSDSTEWANTTEINPNLYETGGTTAATPTNKFTVQRVALFPSGVASSATRLQYGQNVYDSLDDAEASLSTESFIVEGNINDNGLLRGFIIVREGTTDLSNLNLAKFISANHDGHAEDTVVGNVHRTEIINHGSTGLRVGGLITADSATTFKVAAGSGLIIDNATTPGNPVLSEIVWGDITGQTITALSGDVATVIMIDSTENVIQFPLQSPPSQTDKRDKILLGVVAHSDKATITNLYNGPIHIISPINQHEDLTSSIGTFSVNGNFVSGIAGTIELEKSAGSAFYYGGNYQTDKTNPSVLNTTQLSGSSTPSNPLVYATGSEVLGISGYSIDTNNYDPSGLGVITVMSNNKYVAHRIWHLPINNLLVFQYGQEEYNSLNLAIDGFSTESFVEPPGLNLGAYLISVVITKKGESDLSNATTTKFIQQGKFAGTGGGGGAIADTLQTAYNNSTQPEITTDSTRGAVDIKVGSGSDSDNLITFQDTGGNINAWVNGNGEALFSAITATTIKSNTFSGDTGDALYYGDGSNLTGIDNFFTTAATLNSNVLVFDRTDILSAFTVDLSSFVDDTNIYTTGSTLVNNVAYFDTNTTLSAYTLNLTSFVSDDIFVTGATFTGDTLSLSRNDDLIISVTGFSNSDIYTIGATKVGDEVYFDRNDTLSAYSFTLTGLSTTDFFVTGGTFNSNTLTLTRNDDVIISVTGFTDEDIFTTGGTLVGNVGYFDTNNALSAYTIDLSALSVSGTGNDFYTTGSTLIGNTIYFDRNDQLSAYTVDLSSITTSGGTDTIRFHGSRAKANQANIFLRHDDGTPYNIIPYRVYTDGTITNVIASGRDVDTWDAHLLTGTTITTDSIYHLKVIADTNEFDDTVALDVNSGTTIYLYMSGTSVAYPTIDVYIKKR